MKILLADDEVSIQKLISGLLEDEGHECVCVEDGTDALEAFESDSFDLVILDVMMPRMEPLRHVSRIAYPGRNGSGDLSFRKRRHRR